MSPRKPPARRPARGKKPPEARRPVKRARPAAKAKTKAAAKAKPAPVPKGKPAPRVAHPPAPPAPPRAPGGGLISMHAVALAKLTAHLRLEIEGDRLAIEYPTATHSATEAAAALEATGQGLSADLSAGGASWRLTARADRPTLERFGRDFFARLNGVPTFTGVDVTRFEPAAQPLVSIVVVLAANDRFARLQELPSLIQLSAPHPIEIIVVVCHANTDRAPLAPFRLVDGEFCWPARSYNLGARAARGRYLAIFHDDCLVVEPRWIDKCLAALDAGHIATTNELLAMPAGFGIAKCTPLFMRTDEYHQIGGFDEVVYCAFEELELSCRLLAAGRSLASANAQVLHYNGMSSVITYGDRPDFFREVFGYNMLPAEEVASISNTAVALMVRRAPVLERLHAALQGYTLRKHFRVFGYQGGPELPPEATAPLEVTLDSPGWSRQRELYHATLKQLSRLTGL